MNDNTRIRLTPLGEAVVALERRGKQKPLPLTRADLEQFGRDWGIRTDDLWVALDAVRTDELIDGVA